MPNVALVDPKFIDGEPWEVAEAAGKQVSDCLRLTQEALEGFFWAARGSWLSQEDYRTGQMPGPGDFEQSPLGRKLSGVLDDVQTALKKAEAARSAAAHDPRSY